MNDLQLQAEGSANQLTLQIKYPNIPNLTYNFKLSINISKQSSPHNIILHKILYIPEKSIKIEPLQGGNIYKVQVNCQTNSLPFQKTVFSFVSQASNNAQEEDQFYNLQQYIPRVSTQQNQATSRQKNRKPMAKEENCNPLCDSEQLMKMVGRSVGITNQKKLDRYILEGRKCKNTGQFINSRKEFQTANHKKVIEKQSMLLKGKMILRDIYHQKQGCTFFKNDWFMGPFYSYNQNAKDMANQ